MELPKTNMANYGNLGLELNLTWEFNLILAIWVQHQVCISFNKKL